MPQAVPEHVVKKRKAQEAIAADRQATLIKERKENKEARKAMIVRTAKYHKEYKQAAADLVRFRREAKKHGNFFMEPEPKLVLVVRIKGINSVDPKTRKILQLMRLRQINNAVFMKVNSASINMLRLAGEYVTYGPPNLKTVRELIYKRGFASVKKQRMPLTDNKIISEALGEHGITCMEDLIHEIYTVGPKFKECNRFLWPFKMSCAKGGMPKKRLHFIEGGQYGDREELINSLVRKMN
ncbi:large subunit ribosomal protein L7e_1, cytoplasmic [Guillardia theta CCMP2712]|uniref:Large subunit ribosomal protein L7e_1, cytoplasmic n=1 Tax=Guillardia theta (strain CCMP2712) TaxID=905079 RepID=L1JTB7_GUITC|nr:large subunit ribosomal protein L7e_1, cytoplasmic [Guillardia theta CCMP2712]EKX51440.1 large subunit ribosomal protein L7e_1, cytoplasmic [Guillardia theta CCMP2712]|eukprot:XP_005838420.1 large subunit ribosomal protein L7e_1, cytoplasmic [Guillardia theta CCMP2712]